MPASSTMPGLHGLFSHFHKLHECLDWVHYLPLTVTSPCVESENNPSYIKLT